MFVLNKKTDSVPPDAVYIGRGSRWGNPFRIGRDGTRAQVLAKHEAWLKTQYGLLEHVYELRGRDLVCFCSPLPCHGDLLIDLSDMTPDEIIEWMMS